MEQVDVIPQHYFSTHPQPKGLAMKKAVSFLLVLLSLMVFVLSAAFADTETKVYRMDDLEVFCSFYYDANDDLWILTSDRLMQYTSDGVLNEVMENTEKLELVVHDGEKFIGVNQSNQILIYSDGLWTEKAQASFGNEFICMGPGFSFNGKELVYAINSTIEDRDDQVEITVVWNAETNEVKEYYGVFNNGMCTWDDARQAYVGLKKYYANDEDDNDYAWYFVSWVPGNEPEPLLEIDFSTSKWIYGDGKLYCASRRTLSLVSENGSIMQLAETPYLVCMKYMTNGTFAAIDDRDVVIYQIQ
jgi:hypothetical protein